MNNYIALKGLTILVLTLSFLNTVEARPGPCEGPNKNDPGCGDQTQATSFVGEVYSFRTDRFNEIFELTGDGLNSIASIQIGGNPVTIVTSPAATNSLLQIEFDINSSNTIIHTDPADYILNIDGANVGFVHINGAINDATNPSCPCIPNWDIYLEPNSGNCSEITDDTQVSLSTYSTHSNGNLYFVTTAFDSVNPQHSYCALSQVDPATYEVTEIEQTAIGKSDYDVCYPYMITNVCITP